MMDRMNGVENSFCFERKGGVAGNTLLYVFGGLVACGIAFVGFIFAIFGDVGQFALHGMTTFPMLLAISAFTTAWRMARTPQRLIVDDRGIEITGQRDQQFIHWEEIGWSTIVPLPMNPQKRAFIIYDTQGKTLVKLGEAFADFDSMAELIKGRVDARQHEIAESLQLKKSKRSAIYISLVALALFGVAIANVLIAYSDQEAARQLAEEAVPGQAEILRRFMAPNGVTPRLEYTVIEDNGISGSRNAEVTPESWARLEGEHQVAVIYVPGNPKNSRLVEGEPEKNDPAENPVVMYALSAFLGLLCLFFWGAAALQWRGWDIDLDSKTKKISIKRFGEGR